MPTEAEAEAHAEFFIKYAASFPHGEYFDDDENDRIALIVNDEIPIETINTILEQNAHTCDSRLVELADTYDNLPDFDNGTRECTEFPIPATWKSPFIGKSLLEIAYWIRQIPKPPKAINKIYFALLQKELYEQQGKVLICRIFGGKRGVQTIPADARKFGAFLWLYHRERWRYDYKEQELSVI